MILDSKLVFSRQQALTTAGAVASTNTVDLYKTGEAYGNELYLVVQVHTTFTSDGAATLALTLQTSADNSSFTTVHSVAAIGKANLTAGKELVKMRLPMGLSRYNKITYTVGVADMTAGKVNAFLTKDVSV